VLTRLARNSLHELTPSAQTIHYTGIRCDRSARYVWLFMCDISGRFPASASMARDTVCGWQSIYRDADHITGQRLA